MHCVPSSLSSDLLTRFFNNKKSKMVPEVKAVGAPAAPPADSLSGASPDNPAAKERRVVKEFGDWVPEQTGKSRVWIHFKVHQYNHNKAKCNLCDRELSLSDQGTTPMKNHQFQLHNKEHDEAYEDSLKQKAITDSFNSSAIVTRENQLNALARFLCKNYQPISLIKNSNFRDFKKKTVAPKFSFPNRASMKAIIHNKFIALKAKMTILIKNNKLSLTTDGWTSKSKHAFYCYTLYWTTVIANGQLWS